MFIEKSLSIHGNKYDYSLVEYINYNKKVKIICPEHGSFEQSPNHHLHGNGCRKCFYSNRTFNNKNFIEKSNKIHNSKYDYSLVNYINSYTKIEILCSTHGIFKQKPNAHLRGQGCKKCKMNNQSLTTNIFIEKSNKIHNNKYDYKLVNYINFIIDVEIICPDHGIFKQRPSNHLNGSGCRKCSINDIRNKDYIKKCQIKFNNKYDYSLVNYINNKNHVKIICPDHGIFKQSLKDHLKRNGCPYCSGKKMNTELFIKKSIIKHNNFFDYSFVKYIGAFRKVKIVCPDHGLFEQTASSHLFGSGCPICKSSKGEKEIITILNNINIEFIYQKKFEGCKNINDLIFDFFIPSKNLCIEYNGSQHYIPSEYFGGVDGFEAIKRRDKIKKIYCKNKKIKLRVITYKDIIEKKLIKILND